jgi:hypothetical protein
MGATENEETADGRRRPRDDISSLFNSPLTIAVLDMMRLIMRSDGRGLERLGFHRVAVTRSANLNWALSTPVTRILFRYPVSTLHKGRK